MYKKYMAYMVATLVIALSGCSVPSEKVVENNQVSDPTEIEETAKVSEDTTEEDLFQNVRNNEPTNDRIESLEQIAMQYYWYGGDMKKAEEELFSGITLHGDYDVVEQSFARAVMIDPYNIDLRRSLGSAQILQKKIPEALSTYADIIELDPMNVEAYILHAAYSKVEKDFDAYDEDMKKLAEISEALATEYEEKFNAVDEIENTTLNVELPDNLPTENHAFVALGYALSDDGEMQDTLIERLKVTLAAAEEYPNSQIVVTGGVPKEGNTEAELMYDWLVEQGIDEDRIHREALATDTVENALFSIDYIQAEGIQDVTIISSASHMRRALTIFNEISDFMNRTADNPIEREFTNVVYMDFEDQNELSEMTKDEEMVIYRDLIRATGIWQFPELQR